MLRLVVCFALLTGLSLAALGGCDSAEPEAEVALRPGSVRVYSYRSVFTDTSGGETVLHTDTVRARVVATGQRVGDEDGLTEVEYRSTLALSRTWYRQSEDRLVEVAYENPLPVSAQLRVEPEAACRALRVVAGSVVGGDDEGDGPIVRSDPRVVLVYPLEPGRTWLSFSDPFQSERRVEGREQLTVPAGAFDTAVIATTVDIDETLTWLDWLDSGGLVQRRITGPQQLMGPMGEAMSEGILREETVLIATE